MNIVHKPTKNLLAYEYNGTDTRDGHGGMAEEHIEEMRGIAQDEIMRTVPAMAENIYNKAVTRLVGALRYDIDTCVSVTMEQFGEIYNSRKFKQVLSDAVMRQIQASLKDIQIKI